MLCNKIIKHHSKLNLATFIEYYFTEISMSEHETIPDTIRDPYMVFSYLFTMIKLELVAPTVTK